jgi:hypothetical protein
VLILLFKFLGVLYLKSKAMIVQIKYLQEKKLSDKLFKSASLAIENSLFKLMQTHLNRSF